MIRRDSLFEIIFVGTTWTMYSWLYLSMRASGEPVSSIFPYLMKATSVQTSYASAILWVIMMTEIPLRFRRYLKSFNRIIGWRPLVGSSIIRRRGRRIKAIAIASRLLFPPLSSQANLSLYPYISNKLIYSSILLTCSLLLIPDNSATILRFSKTVRLPQNMLF